LKALLDRLPMRLPPQDSARDAVAAPDPMTGSVDRIYNTHFDFVWRNARRLGIPEASADDVVQDVFVIVQRRIGDFDGRTSLRAWIFGILVRVVRDHRRSFRRKAGRCIPLEEVSHGDVAAAEGPTPSELAERAERVQLLDALLDQLGDDKRTLLILSELEQCTLREIAELLGSNTNTIHSRLRAARRDFDKVYTRWLSGKGDAP
jgi:RNA polymerase sigma-70 factor (ECF subfamily)